jgi:hypothetical protein
MPIMQKLEGEFKSQKEQMEELEKTAHANLKALETATAGPVQRSTRGKSGAAK